MKTCQKISLEVEEIEEFMSVNNEHVKGNQAVVK